jgi:hypothetical protein
MMQFPTVASIQKSNGCQRKPRSHRVDIQHSFIEFVIATPIGLAISLFSGQCASENRLNLPEFPLA